MEFIEWNILTLLYPHARDADIQLVSELSEELLNLPVKPRFVVMLAFAEPLSTV